MRAVRQSTCAGHGKARKWGADWVSPMAVQPTKVVYSFLMRVPVLEHKTKMKQRKTKRAKKCSKEINVPFCAWDCNTYWLNGFRDKGTLDFVCFFDGLLLCSKAHIL
jgi:hypothetical protein